jgi:predicted PurR-regulated permease PerM
MSRRSAAPRGIEAVAGTSALETLVVLSVVVAGLYLGRAIAIPIAIAVLISFCLGPAVSWLRRHHLGRIPSIIIAVVPALLALVAFAYVVTIEVGRLAGNVQAYQTNIEGKINSVADALPSRMMLDRGSDFIRKLKTGGVKQAEQIPATPPPVSVPSRGRGAAKSVPPAADPMVAAKPPSDKPIAVEIQAPEPGPLDLFRSILGPLVEPVSDAGLVLLFVIFFLAERETLRDRVIRLAGAKDLHRTTMLMDEAGKRLSRFLLLQTAVNAGFGVVVTLGLLIIGLPNAALWGAMAAILRFIPYLGVAASSILPLLLAFAVDPGWTMLFWTAGLFVVLELIVGNIFEPWLYGTSTGLSAVALVVSVIFWTWLWGSIGLLLATPLTVCIAVIGRYVPPLAFLEILLGNQAALKPEESFYQRLLAGDPAEATSQAEDFLKTRSLAEFYDEVALPALLLAERDRSRGELEDEQMKHVAAGVREVDENLAPDAAKPSRSIWHPRGAAKAAEPLDVVDDASDVVLCVAGRTELDEAAAALLARLAEGDGRRVVTLPHNSAIRIALPDLDASRIKIVCLSYLDPESAPHARYLARRFRRRVGGDICLFVAFWGLGQNVARLENIRGETRADRVVGTLQAAAEAIEAAGRGTTQPRIEAQPELDELAQRISEVMSRTG